MTDQVYEPVFLISEDIDDIERHYRTVLPVIRAVARTHGYAIGEHGSMRRDMDLIAAPWVEHHSSAEELAAAIQMACCGLRLPKYRFDADPPKPCGRQATVFAIGMMAFVDLSVMPALSPLLT